MLEIYKYISFFFFFFFFFAISDESDDSNRLTKRSAFLNQNETIKFGTATMACMTWDDSRDEWRSDECTVRIFIGDNAISNLGHTVFLSENNVMLIGNNNGYSYIACTLVYMYSFDTTLCRLSLSISDICTRTALFILPLENMGARLYWNHLITLLRPSVSTVSAIYVP